MKILLTNDDGIHYPGIIEFAKVLRQNHDVFTVAPRTEQSGISQSITFLRPLFPVALKDGLDPANPMNGFSVDGTPTDCVKLGLFELCPFKPDLVLSGINGGLNAGSNVCYSGTVAGAFAGALFGFPSMAISLEYANPMNFKLAAETIVPIIENLAVKDWPNQTALNINLPTSAIEGKPAIKLVPVESNPLGYSFEKGIDPKGRPFYWSNNKPDPEPSDFETDCSELKKGCLTISPITYDPNAKNAMDFFAGQLDFGEQVVEQS